jgi:alkanesulfonate monooxygenase SsuD/methylene tetrahydromethanopterin reductase-like flavin-dependent oxidoreductase (luciferase family)
VDAGAPADDVAPGVSGLRLGINLWSQAGTWPELLEAARLVDRLGYETLWTWDHLHAIVGDPHQPIFEGWGVVHAWAATTVRVRLGVLVAANTFRNPGLLAKSAVTLDHVSQGRAVLGMGAAWHAGEHEAHGIDFGTGFGQRIDWLGESVAAVRALLGGDTVTSPADGRYAFRNLRHDPRPVQTHLPLMIGGSGRQKTLRLVARHADMWNALGTPAVAAELAQVLSDRCAEIGRDPAEIDRSVNLWAAVRDTEGAARTAWAEWMSRNRAPVEETISEIRPLFGPPAQVAARLLEYVEAGFSSVIFEVPAPYDRETLERLIGEVKQLVDAG